MQLRDDAHRYGLVSVLLHWSVALVVIGLFALGLWMTSLSYYDPWYRLGPWWHKGIGAVLFAVVLLRLGWRLWSGHPQPLPNHQPWERNIARLVHGLLYLLLLAIMVSGYLISTADGRPLVVFDLFAIPAVITGLPNQEDIAGQVHLLLACSLVALVILHALAALKHAFIDKDRTLARMLGR